MKTNEKLKVLLTTNVPAPYMVEYLDLLGRRCELTVLFETGAAKNRQQDWYGKMADRSFKSIFLNAVLLSKETGLSFKVLKYLNRRYDRIIIGNPATPTGILAIVYCKLFRIPFILQSEGGFAKGGKSFKERFKYFLMHDAEMYLSGMYYEREYFRAYGATKEKLRRYPFASFFERDILPKPLTPAEKQAIRECLGVTEDRVIVSVGRIIPSKAYDVLLEAVKDIPRDVGVYIIGGKATPDLQKLVDDYALSNVHFVEFMSKECLWEYYQMADFLTLPTRMDTWGLFVNEAMANGLPVITTNKCVAGLELIEENENGFLIDVDDTAALTDRIRRLLDDDALREKMATNNLEKIRPHTFENMAETIAVALGLVDTQ